MPELSETKQSFEQSRGRSRLTFQRQEFEAPWTGSIDRALPKAETSLTDISQSRVTSLAQGPTGQVIPRLD